MVLLRHDRNSSSLFYLFFKNLFCIFSYFSNFFKFSYYFSVIFFLHGFYFLFYLCIYLLTLFIHLFILQLHVWHMEVPKLGVEWQLELPACATATAMWDPSRICNLHHSSQQCQILKPLSQARDRTCILMVTSPVHYCRATIGTPSL